MGISGVKFEEHVFNISSDILYSIFIAHLMSSSIGISPRWYASGDIYEKILTKLVSWLMPIAEFSSQVFWVLIMMTTNNHNHNKSAWGS